MKIDKYSILLILILLIGLSLLLYPSFSDYWNSFTSSRAITTYSETIATMDDDQYREIWDAAYAYNESLVYRDNPYLTSWQQKQQYQELLNISGNGVMGYIEIPKIKVEIPIYHGTEEAILQIAIGHLEWTSLPVGGETSHCVVSGHRGLPSARLFTDLDKLQVGDVFMLYIMDETLTYEVDQIKIVEPYRTDDLLIVEGEDYCTLVTCTPYGINSHRMLVRGVRTDNVEEKKTIRVSADAIQIEPIIVAPFVAAPMLLVLLIILMLPKPKKQNPKDIQIE